MRVKCCGVVAAIQINRRKHLFISKFAHLTPHEDAANYTWKCKSRPFLAKKRHGVIAATALPGGGYYDFLTFERRLLNDPDHVATTHRS